MKFDHVGILVDDLEAAVAFARTDAARLREHGVRFTGPLSPDEVDAPVDMRGRRHLWTVPATSSGFRLQMTERADS